MLEKDDLDRPQEGQDLREAEGKDQCPNPGNLKFVNDSMTSSSLFRCPPAPLPPPSDTCLDHVPLGTPLFDPPRRCPHYKRVR